MNKIICFILTLQVAKIGINIISTSLKFLNECDFLIFRKGARVPCDFTYDLVISGKQSVCSSSLFTKGKKQTKKLVILLS